MTAMLVGGDCCIKMATKGSPLGWLLLAGLLWSGSIYGWYVAMRGERFAVVCTVFSVMSLVFTAMLGVTAFGEHLSAKEWTGIALGVVAILLLTGKA